MYSVSLREATQILDVSMDEIRRKIKKGELWATQVVTPGGLGMGVALPGDPPDGVAQFPGNSSQNSPAVEQTPSLSELFKDSPLMQPMPESQAQAQGRPQALPAIRRLLCSRLPASIWLRQTAPRYRRRLGSRCPLMDRREETRVEAPSRLSQ